MILWFTAPWCAPCKKLRPNIAASGKPVTEIDISDSANIELVKQHNVRSVPVMIQGDTVSIGYEECVRLLRS